MSSKPKWLVPQGGSLNPPSPEEFEFIKNVGYRYNGDGRSLILSSCSIRREGDPLDDKGLLTFAEHTTRYLDTIGGFEGQDYNKAAIFRDKDFRQYGSRFAYKFVTEETFERFVSKGRFLLSSLARFREFEGQGSAAGDRFEGFAHSAYAVGDRQLTASTISGFDTNILSLARDLRNVDVMRQKFGPVVLRIKLLPFAWALARLARSAPPDIRLIRYADLKLYRGELTLREVAGFPPQLTARLARALRIRGRAPSLFGKPSRFEEEREVRIALPAAADVPSSTEINEPRLLRYVERIDA